eukprot:CAMPEP_0194396726 /NCGR_PEP_ID=MMETSP0174-20130528/125149_1 /TAXON_ID=216777 /ORGANISM="Proboscia alata, Strain PI-D3" /LENGTH=266 /DNA_ID=CAMNT_0039192825 /DNA_START=84 /DNA_END=884 /DNA_ORIENTATION=+
MKFINLVTLFIFSSEVSSVNGAYCGTVPETLYTGIARTIDVDGSGPFPPTMGDISIAENIIAVGNSPSSVVSIKAICTLTADDPTSSAPFCQFESTLDLSIPGTATSYQGKTIAMGTPPLLGIIGGMGSFMGAYGQFDTLNSLVITQNDDFTISLTFSAVISFCIPDDQPPTGPSFPSVSPPNSPIVSPPNSPIVSPPTGSPPTSPTACVDSTKWKTKDNGSRKGCGWVAKGDGNDPSPTRCAKMGKENGKESSGYVSCPLACGMC